MEKSKNTVIRSINNNELNLCVDIFKRKNSTYGFEEFRRDPEDLNGWYKIGSYGSDFYLNEDEAYKAAFNKIKWLNDIK